MITLSRAKELSAAVIMAQDELNRAVSAAAYEGVSCTPEFIDITCIGDDAQSFRIEVMTTVNPSKMEAK